MNKDSIPGFTLRSFSASILAILLAGLLTQFAGSTMAWGRYLSGEALSIPALDVVFALVLVCSGIFILFKIQVLSREEMVCVLYATIIASVLMGPGFWRPMIGISGTIARSLDWEKYDALPDKAWAHGPNEFAGMLSGPGHPGIDSTGQVTWESAILDNGTAAKVPRLVNANTDGREAQRSILRLTIPITQNGRYVVWPGQPYIVSVLSRANNLSPDSYYYCRLSFDDKTENTQEVFTSRDVARKTFPHPAGFIRTGAYGITMPRDLKQKVTLEFGLVGAGELGIWDPQLINVSAEEDAYAGRQMIRESDFYRLAASERVGLVVEPDHWWSWRGLQFLLVGYFPWRAWFDPVMVWVVFAGLALVAVFAVGVLIRKQWLQSERFPMPLAQVPLALLGEEEGGTPSVLKNKLMWIGFGLALVWSACNARTHAILQFPDLSVSIDLKTYLPGSNWGKTWDGVAFTVTPLLLAIGLLMELNILVSFVLGFLLFRLQFWVGEINGAAAEKDYPYDKYQTVGAFAMYAILILVFNRRYILQVLGQVLSGPRETGEAISYRSALFVILATFGGTAAWSAWVGVPILPMLCFFAIFVAFMVIAAKFRVECGTPGALFAPSILFAAIFIGGFYFFKPNGMVMVVFANRIFAEAGFFVLPGLILELLELGHRFRVRGRDIAFSVLLGFVGGIVIGGWIYFSSAYAIGARNYPVTGDYGGQGGFDTYADQAQLATERMINPATVSGAFSHPTWAGAFGAGATLVLTLLRQASAGFWFHPVGFILGSSAMVSQAWGSLLAAWLVRFMVLQLGGAQSVKNQLIPVATGMLLGSSAVMLFFLLTNGYLYFFHPGAPTINP